MDDLIVMFGAKGGWRARVDVLRKIPPASRGGPVMSVKFRADKLRTHLNGVLNKRCFRVKQEIMSFRLDRLVPDLSSLQDACSTYPWVEGRSQTRRLGEDPGRRIPDRNNGRHSNM